MYRIINLKNKGWRDYTIKKNDLELQKKYGKQNPFTVPEGYFEHFTENLMERLPEKEVKALPEIKLWDRVKPWIYMAAMFVGLMFTVRAFVGTTQSADDSDNLTDMPDEYIESIVDQTMMDDYELYQYLTDADAGIYN